MSYPLFPDTSTEPSAAGARRGVCNCIQTTILLGPPAEGRLGPSDLYIIGAVCLCVCQQKSLFLYSKDLSVSHVYRHIPYSRYFVISPVYRHFLYSRYFVISPVYRHFLYPRYFVISPVYRHFPYSRYFVISPVYRHHIPKSV